MHGPEQVVSGLEFVPCRRYGRQTHNRSVVEISRAAKREKFVSAIPSYCNRSAQLNAQ